MTGFGSSPPRGRRAAPRSQAPLVVELLVDGSKHSAEMHEISRTGAKVSNAPSMEVGQELTFRAGTVRAVGEVVWSAEAECAIAFDMPIAPAEVSRLRSLAGFVTSVSEGAEKL